MAEDGVFRGPIAVRRLGAKGRGLVTTREVPEGEHLCTDPCVMITDQDCIKLEYTSLHGHYFAHPESQGEGCIVWGPISLINHSPEPNCRLEWIDHAEVGWIVRLYARHRIPAGEELTIDYVCDLWFEPIENVTS
jgi:hypothetical protein